MTIGGHTIPDTNRCVLPNAKARERLLELKRAAIHVEALSVYIGGYCRLVSEEKFEKYKQKVQDLLQKYKQFLRALNDDGVR